MSRSNLCENYLMADSLFPRYLKARKAAHLEGTSIAHWPLCQLFSGQTLLIGIRITSDGRDFEL